MRAKQVVRVCPYLLLTNLDLPLPLAYCGRHAASPNIRFRSANHYNDQVYTLRTVDLTKLNDDRLAYVIGCGVDKSQIKDLTHCSITIPVTWAKFTEDNLTRSQQEREKSAKLRGAVDGLLRSSAAEMWSQHNAVDNALNGRIQEMSNAKSGLQGHLEKVSICCSEVGSDLKFESSDRGVVGEDYGKSNSVCRIHAMYCVVELKEPTYCEK